MTRYLLICLSFVILVTASLLAPSAADSDDFQRHLERGRRSFLSERYEEALAEFKAAHDAKPLPRLLINIGQSYRKLGKLQQALDAYRAYLEADRNPDPAVKQKVDGFISQTEALLASSGSRAATMPPSSQDEVASRNNTEQDNDPEKRAHTTRFRTVPSHVAVDLHSIAGRAPDDLWAAGDDGTLLHYDGKQWLASYQGWGGTLTGVAGSRPDDVWAVGEKGLCMHFDGSAWHVAPRLGEVDLAGVWTDDLGTAWAIDAKGFVQYFDGTDWFAPRSGDHPEGITLTAVAAAATSSNARWIVGLDGAIVRWNGKTLTKVLSSTRSSLFSVWQSEAKDAWAVGQGGTLLRHNGKAWKSVVSPTKLSLFAVWGSSPSDVWAAGGSGFDASDEVVQGVILHYDGTNWSIAVEALPGRVRALWGTGPHDVFAADENGAIYHHDGDVWAEMPRRTRETIHGLWGSSAADIWAVGSGGAVLHYDGRAWSSRWRRPRHAFQAVWQVGPDDVWAVGEKGTILHRDAAGWAVSESGTTKDIHAVWASGSKNAWAAGDNGVLLHWDGAAWSGHKSGVQEKLTALWGTGPTDVWAGGELMTLLHYDGRAWTTVPNPLPGEINRPTVNSIWGAGPGDIWAVGDVWAPPGDRHRVLLHYDGISWKNQPASPRAHLNGVMGRDANNVWIVGGIHYDDCAEDRPQSPGDTCPALFLRYDGTSWHKEDGPSVALKSVWTGGGEVWAVGEKGTIVHRSAD